VERGAQAPARRLSPALLGRLNAALEHRLSVALEDPKTASRAQLALAAAIVLGLAALTVHFNVTWHHGLNLFGAVPDALRGLAATVVLFGVAGFGLVRLLLPDALRDYELLWILPTGGCAVGLVMTALGFAGVPYLASLALVPLGGVALGAAAVRRRGWPGLPARLAWPVFLAIVVTAIALLPVISEQHYAAPVGNGSDAHVAAGAANFLKHTYPTATDVSQPINQMPPTWQSKFPIYYAFAGVSSLSGLQTWQLLPILAAAMLGMAAVGFFLLARNVLGAPVAVAVATMMFAALDRMALHTVLNPYFNQTWGFFAMPFTVVLGWWVVQPGLTRRAREATVALLALFALVLALAYPLAAPIPAVPIAMFLWLERRRRIAAGERVLRPRDLYRGPRSLVWIVPLAALLAIPVAGAVEKAISAASVLAPGHSLMGWAGDVKAFIPFQYFLSLPSSWLGYALALVVLYLAYRGLRAQPRPLAYGLGGLLVLGLLLAFYLRQRPYGFYFHFKLLAFIGPLLLVAAAVGAGAMRRRGVVLMVGLAVAVAASAFSYIRATGIQLHPGTIQLSGWARHVPTGASIRLDMWPPYQLWAGYFLASRPLCSQQPILGTDYPHVPISRKADYIIATRASGRPSDAVGPPLRTNRDFQLFRENPAVPGPSYCSQRRLDRIYSGAGHSAN
jgi:hypothetical protein